MDVTYKKNRFFLHVLPYFRASSCPQGRCLRKLNFFCLFVTFSLSNRKRSYYIGNRFPVLRFEIFSLGALLVEEEEEGG